MIKITAAYCNITIGEFLIAIASVKGQIDNYYIFSNTYYNIIVVLSIVFFIIGIVLIVLSYYNSSNTSTFIDYDTEIAKYSDLKTLHDLCTKMLGNDVVNLQIMNKIYNRNCEVFMKVIETKTKGSFSTNKIVGFFDILPLDEKTSLELEKGLINTGSLLTNKILKKNETPNSIYIGGVFAINYKAKAATLAFLKAAINSYIKEGVKKVYARPTTDIGFRLVSNSGFSPIDDDANDKLNKIYHKLF